MAKKKKKSTAPAVEKVDKTSSLKVADSKSNRSKKSMKEKAEAKTAPEPVTEIKSDEGGAVGSSILSSLIKLIVLFVLLLGFIFILAFGINRLFPGTNDNLPVPVIEKRVKDRIVYTNDDEVELEITIDDDADRYSVMVYVNGKKEGANLSPNDKGVFEFRKALSDEGEYRITAKSLRKGLVWQVSPESDEFKVVYDTTPPSAEIVLDYEKEADVSTIDLEGVAEADSKVILKSEDKEYEARADDKGRFKIEGVELTEGENSFEITIEDRAGNKVTSSKKVVVNYIVGSVNGEGARVDGRGAADDLPRSSGELSLLTELFAMKEFLFAILMIGLLVFMGSSAVLAVKSVRQ